MLATVIVPTRDRAALLENALEALLDQDLREPYEIVVVDDGSRDGTPELLERLAARSPEQIRFLRHAVSRGPATARNAGARLARGAVLAFTDDDCVPDRSWLTELVRALEHAPGAGGSVVNRTRTWIGRFMNREHTIANVPVRANELETLVTANAAFRKDDFWAIGGFDETFPFASGEDYDLAIRLRATGRSIVYADAAVVEHDAYETVGSFLRMVFRHGRGAFLLGVRYDAHRMNDPLLGLLRRLSPVRRSTFRYYRELRRSGLGRVASLRDMALTWCRNIVFVVGYLYERRRIARCPRSS